MKIFIPNRYNAWIWSQFILMIIGIYLLNWKTDVIIVAFTFEGLLLGFIQFVKMQTIFWIGEKQQFSFSQPKVRDASVFFKSLVYFLIYNLFCAAHLLFVFVFVMNENPSITNPLDFYSNSLYYFSSNEFVQALMASSMAVVYHTIEHFYQKKKYNDFTVDQLYTPTFLRIFLQQLFIIFAGYLFMTFGETKSIALLLISSCFIVDILFAAARKDLFMRQKLAAIFLKWQHQKLDKEEDKASFVDAIFES